MADDLRGPDARDDAPTAFVRRLEQMAKGYGYVIRGDEQMQMATDALAELGRLGAERAATDLDARLVAAVPALLATCTEAEKTAAAATAVDGLDRTPALLTTNEVRAAIAAAAPGELTSELERLRARVAELEAGTEVRVQYGYRRSDGALALAAPHETRRHVLDMAEPSGETAVQWEVHTRTGPVTVVSS